MNNKLPQIHLIYNRYKKASTIKKAVVEIRVTYNYQQKCHHQIPQYVSISLHYSMLNPSVTSALCYAYVMLMLCFTTVP